MITGYNTDVKYGEITLHVQTEDKGEGNPFIESLVYYGGQVVVAKRASYADKLQSGDRVGEITTLMEHQHRTMMRAIQAGKFDDKIRLFVPDKERTRPQGASPSDTSDAFDLADESGRTLDQVILEYLTSEAEQEQLVLSMSEDGELSAGTSTYAVFQACSSRTGDAIAGAKVNVKMISTFGGPHVLGSGETGEDGQIQLRLDVPPVEHGTAALIVTASSPIGQAELKHLL